MSKNKTEDKELNELLKNGVLLRKTFSEKISEIKVIFGESSDFTVRQLGNDEQVKIAILYFDTLAEKQFIEEFVVKEYKEYLQANKGIGAEENVSNLFISQLKISSVKEAVEQLLEGNSVILIENIEGGFVAKSEGGERRGVSEPVNTTLVRGSHEAFNESLSTNIGLLRKRINNYKFRVDILKIGKETNTPVAIVYINGIAKKELVSEIKQRLEDIEIDSVLESYNLQECIEDYQGYTPFPTMFDSELPDQIAGGLLEGRIAILTEGTPIALLAPVTMNLFLSSNEDYYQRYDIASFLRVLRTVTFQISLSFPAFYIVLLTFHQEMIPTSLLIALTGQREGVPFSVAIEVLLMELTFEILREAGLRLPKSIGSAVSIVGGLVLGQAVVEAGLVGAGTVITVALTAISSACTPSYSLAIAARLIRLVLIFFGAALGGFGLMFGLIFVFVHLNTLRSLGVPYLAPVIPFHKHGWYDAFFRMPNKSRKFRPEEIVGENKQRVANKK
ncbi:spore germination protein [Bacillaceae bacterium IKA-2]|nr:spore germination protein [Bacillaceae bacterium IKA-2]